MAVKRFQILFGRLRAKLWSVWKLIPVPMGTGKEGRVTFTLLNEQTHGAGTVAAQQTDRRKTLRQFSVLPSIHQQWSIIISTTRSMTVIRQGRSLALSRSPVTRLLTKGLQHYGFKKHQLLSLLEVGLKFDRQPLHHSCNESISPYPHT